MTSKLNWNSFLTKLGDCGYTEVQLSALYKLYKAGEIKNLDCVKLSEYIKLSKITSNMDMAAFYVSYSVEKQKKNANKKIKHKLENFLQTADYNQNIFENFAYFGQKVSLVVTAILFKVHTVVKNDYDEEIKELAIKYDFKGKYKQFDIEKSEYKMQIKYNYTQDVFDVVFVIGESITGELDFLEYYYRIKINKMMKISKLTEPPSGDHINIYERLRGRVVADYYGSEEPEELTR
jgi:hypothetical protein